LLKRNDTGIHPDSRQTPEEQEERVQGESSIQRQEEEEDVQTKASQAQLQAEENKVRVQPAVRVIQRKDYSVHRQPEEEGLQTERQGPPTRYIVPPTSTIQRNDVSWEVHSWKLEPEKPLPIMTGNEYADWIEGSKTEEPTSMNCWQALLFSLHKAGTLSRSQLKAIHIRTKVLALAQIPMEKITPEKAKMFAVQYDIHYARALKVVINDAPWKRITTRRWNEDIPAGNIIRINQGSKVLHWLLSEGTERVTNQVVHRVKDLGSGTGAPILQDRTLQEALDQFGYGAKGSRGEQLKTVQVYHTQPFWK